MATLGHGRNVKVRVAVGLWLLLAGGRATPRDTGWFYRASV